MQTEALTVYGYQPDTSVSPFMHILFVSEDLFISA